MNLSKYMHSFHGLQVEAKWQRIVTGFLMVLCAFLAWSLANRDAVVTIQPWTLAEDAQVTRDDASRSYLEAWGFALAELVGNVTPGNVRFISDRLKPILDPAVYHAVLEGLEANAKTLADERISLRFEPRSVTFEKSTGKVFVYGRSYSRLGSSMEKEVSEERTYEFLLKIANYAPLQRGINPYKGPPMTRDVAQKVQDKQATQEQKEREQIRENARYVEPKANVGVHTDEDRKLQ